METDQIIVSVCSITYNHARYIRQCIDSFLMQDCDFRFEIIINDDCSTDGTTEILREYEYKYPGLITVIYHEENQYKKGVRGMFTRFVFPKAKGKYIAMCEGDDYWTEPYKLQKQVDWLEAHPDYSMCCCDAKIVTPSGEVDWHRYKTDSDISPQDMIGGGGLFVQTATILYRNGLLDNYPDCCKKCHVGDYPLQIWATLNGKVRYFSDKMAVYRFANSNSWTSKVDHIQIEKQIFGCRSEVDMLQGLDGFSNYKYHKEFIDRQVLFVYSFLRRNPDNWIMISKSFEDVIAKFDLKQKIEHYLMCYGGYPIVTFLRKIG